MLVLQSDSVPLLGMTLLWGSRVTVDALGDGEVIVKNFNQPSDGKSKAHATRATFGCTNRTHGMGEIVGGTVLFGDADTEPLLGMTALESVGIKGDPSSQTLKRLPAVRLKSLRTSSRK